MSNINSLLLLYQVCLVTAGVVVSSESLRSFVKERYGQKWNTITPDCYPHLLKDRTHDATKWSLQDTFCYLVESLSLHCPFHSYTRYQCWSTPSAWKLSSSWWFKTSVVQTLRLPQCSELTVFRGGDCTCSTKLHKVQEQVYRVRSGNDRDIKWRIKAAGWYKVNYSVHVHHTERTGQTLWVVLSFHKTRWL